jgi:hypothetical protein
MGGEKMNQTDCKLEPVSNRTIGLILMLIGLMFTFMGIAIIPVVGLVFAFPVLILSVIFLASPRSEACAVIAKKHSEHSLR